MNTKKIHSIKDGKVETVLDGGELNRPNGLFFDDDKLLIGIAGKISVLATIATGPSDGTLPSGIFQLSTATGPMVPLSGATIV